MNDDASTLLLDTFVELADTLVGDYDVGEFLQLLVDRCTDLLLADTAGVLLGADRGSPALAAATSEEMLKIEDLEIGLGQGPCMEAFRTGKQVLVENLDNCYDRWPQVTPRIIDIGMRSAAAFPLRLREYCIGALNLYRSQAGAFESHEVRLGQALADVAAVGILQERSVHDAERRAEQLQRAFDSRVLIEQAKGVLAERRNISVAEAFAALRRHARSNNLKLRDVCRQVINGELELKAASVKDRRGNTSWERRAGFLQPTKGRAAMTDTGRLSPEDETPDRQDEERGEEEPQPLGGPLGTSQAAAEPSQTGENYQERDAAEEGRA